MNPFRLGFVFSLIVLAALRAQSPQPAANPSGARVGALGSPEMIDFAGNDTFPARALRKGLSGLPEFLLAAHPAAPLEGYLAMVRQALERGYHGQGFLHARIETSNDTSAGRVRVTIAEGRRFFCGDIRIEGASAVPAPEIVRDLTETSATAAEARTLEQAIETVINAQHPATTPPAHVSATAAPRPPAAAFGANTGGVFGPNSAPGQEAAQAFVTGLMSEPVAPFWARGDPAPFRSTYPEEASTRVRTFLAARGYGLAHVTARLETEPAAGTAHLRLKIHEGARARIGRITVLGANRNTPAEIIACTGLQPDAEVTPAALARAKVALWNSTRFYSFDVKPAPVTPPGDKVDLLVTVAEIPSRPPLREPLPEVEAALVRFANWVTTQATRREMAFTIRHREQFVSVATSAARGLAFLAADNHGKMGLMVADPNIRLLLKSKGGQAKREFGRPGTEWTVQTEMLTKADAENSERDTWLKFGLAWRTSKADSAGSPVQFELTMSPAFACLGLLRDATASIETGEVILRDATTGREQVRFRADTGELTAWALSRQTSSTKPDAEDIQISQSTFDAVTQQVDAAWRELPTEATTASLVQPLLVHPLLRSWLEDKTSGAGSQAGFARTALLARIGERLLLSPEIVNWWKQWRADDREPDFPIPPDPARVSQPGAIAAMLAAVYYQYSALLWPPDTWPAKASRELFYIISGNTSYTQQVLDELHHDPNMGPIGSIVVAQLLRAYDARAAWRFARRALDRSTAADFRRDWNLLFDNSSQLALIADNVIRGLVTIPEREIDEMTAALAPADASLVRRSFAELRRSPERPAAETLEPLLNEWWTKQIEPTLEDRIGQLLAGDAPVDPAIAAFTVNGEPVHRKFIRSMSTTGQLRPAVPRRRSDASRPPADVSRDALIGLVLLAQDFVASGGSILPEVIEQKIQAALKIEYGGDWERFTANLTRLGLTLADQREIHRLLEISREMRTRLSKDIGRPTPAEIQQAMRTLPPPQETRTLQAILVPRSARITADQIQAQAVQEGSFASTWARHEKNDPSLPRRTLLSDISRRDLSTRDLAEAAFALEQGGISPVIESGDNCYILHLVSRNTHDSPAERRQRAINLALDRKRDAAVLAHIDQLRANAVVRTLPDPAATIVNATPPGEGTRLEFESLRAVRSLRTRVTTNNTAKSGGEARWSGGRTMLCTSDNEGWVEWHFTVPSEGTYRLDLLAARGMNRPQIQASVDGRNLGHPLELHAANIQPSGPVALGDIRLAAGLHQLRFTVVGKHASSTGWVFGLDALDIVPIANAPAANSPASTASAPDLIEIISVSPAQAREGVSRKFNVRVRYSLGSVPHGIIGVGFNSADSKSYRLITRHKVSKGSGEIDLSATTVPKIWDDGQRFMAYVNLSPDPHPPRWTPLSTHTRVINVQAASAQSK